MPDLDELKKRYPLLCEPKGNSSELRHQRYLLAWEEAKKAGVVLKSVYYAERVVVFGSLTSPDRFDDNSDIDLAVSGIPDQKFYAAVGTVTHLIGKFKVDLVDINDCKDYLKKAIMEEGIEI